MNFDHRRGNVEHKEAHQKPDASRAPFEVSRQSAGAAVEVEIEVQFMHVLEDLADQYGAWRVPSRGQTAVAQ